MTRQPPNTERPRSYSDRQIRTAEFLFRLKMLERGFWFFSILFGALTASIVVAAFLGITQWYYLLPLGSADGVTGILLIMMVRYFSGSKPIAADSGVGSE